MIYRKKYLSEIREGCRSRFSLPVVSESLIVQFVAEGPGFLFFRKNQDSLSNRAYFG